MTQRPEKPEPRKAGEPVPPAQAPDDTGMSGKLGRVVYRTRRWKALRRKVLDAAGWRCSRCSVPGAAEVHHRTKIADGCDPFDESNLIVLCKPCHHGLHRLEQAPYAAAQDAYDRELRKRLTAPGM